MIPVGEVRDHARLEELLGGAEMAWLRRRVRDRLEAGGAVGGSASLRDPTPAQREGVDRILGRRRTSGSTMTVDLAAVDRILRDAGICDGLPAAVTALEGPLVDRRAAARQQEARWREVHARLADGLAGQPWAESYLDEVVAGGLLRRLAAGPPDAASIVDDLLRVLASLPADGVGLARFAAAVLADSHALDDDRPVATLVLKAVQHRSGGGGPLPSGEDRRALWASVGVLRDELAAPVLVHALPARGGGLTGSLLAAHAEVGEPARLTLRQLVRDPPDLAVLAGRTVFVCENPAVVAAAADALGARSRPLVCVEGQPASAPQTLLRMLRDAGAALAYHGDFDWGGIRIANLVVDRFGARPWRYGRESYERAPNGPPLRGRPVTASWDVDLADAMLRRGVAVHEEQVLSGLLQDLGGPS